MEFLDRIKILTVPAWVKWLIILIVFFVGTTNAALFFAGVFDHERIGWVKPSIELMSVVLPIFIVTLLVTKSDAGVRSLSDSTETLLTKTLPPVLSKITDSQPEFFNPVRKASPPARRAIAKVLINFQKGDCYCDFAIYVPIEGATDTFTKMIVRIEVNVYKVNVDIYLKQNIVAASLKSTAFHGDTSIQGLRRYLDDRFDHSLAGAKHGPSPAARNAEATVVALTEAAPESQGYFFNPGLLERKLGGEAYVCLVGVRHFSKEFLWDPAEKLFFAQDLMFMLRALVGEAADLFEDVDERDIAIQSRG